MIVIVGVMAVALAAALAGSRLLALFGPRVKDGNPAWTDAGQLRQIHTSFAVWARDWDGECPLPSLAARTAPDQPEDFTLNHTANIYSMMVMGNWLSPEILVSPVKTAPYVRVADYQFEAYNPAAGVYWDPSFVMRIDDPAIGANGSYAHLVAVGDRRRLTGDASMPILANRAPPPWATPGQPAYDRSPTLRFNPPIDRWSGNVCFADNHVELLTSYFPAQTRYRKPDGTLVPDNIFAAEFDSPHGPQAAGDAFLAIYIAATEFTVEPVYDPPE